MPGGQKTINIQNQWKKYWVFQKFLFWICLGSEIVFVDIYCSIDNSVEKVSTKNRNPIAPCLNMMKKFWKNNIFINFLQWTHRIQISRPAGKTPTEKVSLSIPNLWKKLWFWDFFPKRFLWLRRMQFRQNSVRIGVPEGPKDFAQSTKAMKGTYKNFQENFFPQNVLPDTKTAVLTTPPKKLPTKAESVRSLFEYDKTQIFCSKKLSLKIFLRTRIRQFWQPRWKYFVKRPKLSVHSSKKMENFSFFDIFFVLKILLQTRSVHFWQPTGKGIARTLEKTIKIPKQWTKYWKFQKNFRLKKISWTGIIAVLTIQSELLRQKSNKFWHHVQRWYFFSKSAVVFINFSQRTCSVQISEPRRKKFDRKGSLKIPKNSKRFNCLQNFDFWNCLYGDVECRFHNPAWKTSTEKVPLKIPKNKEWFNSLKFFFCKYFYGHVERISDTIFVWKTLPECQTDFAHCTKRWKEPIILLQYFFSSKPYCRHYESNFENPAGKSLTEGQKFCVQWPQKIKKFFLFRIFFRLKKLIRTRSMQFWQSSREKLPGMREKFDRCPEFISKITIFEAENFVLKFFLNVYNAVLTTPFEKFRQKPTRFCSTFKKDS